VVLVQTKEEIKAKKRAYYQANKEERGIWRSILVGAGLGVAGPTFMIGDVTPLMILIASLYLASVIWEQK